MTISRRSTLRALAPGLALGALAARRAEAEPQPHMRAALDHLRQARASLERAASDKGGHRVKAIELVDAAIEHVTAGIGAGNR